MKYTKYILTLAIILITFVGFAQVKEPGDPGGTPVGEPPLGGGAPVGGGVFVLMGLGLAYGAVKTVSKKETEEEEVK